MLQRVDDHGRSDPLLTLAELAVGNRAGFDESTLTLQEILKHYTD